MSIVWTPEEAQKWANERGIRGKKGSTYLYCKAENGALRLYKPFWTGRAVQGYRHLASLLTDWEKKP